MGDVCALLFANVFDALGGDADDQTTGREFLVLGHQSAGGDDGALAYLRAVEDGGAHAYEAAVRYLAAVDDGLVADDAIVAHDSRVAGIGVQYAAVLDVGAGPVLPANGRPLSLLTPREDTKPCRKEVCFSAQMGAG